MNGLKFTSALAALTLTVASMVAPALARDSYVVDGANLFKSATVSRLNGEISDFHSTTGKEIVVVTEPTLGGKTLSDAVESAFAKEQVNGVLFYFAKAEKKDAIVGDRASKAFSRKARSAISTTRCAAICATAIPIRRSSPASRSCSTSIVATNVR